MSDEETKTICGTCGTPIFIVEETEEDGVVWAHGEGGDAYRQRG